MLRARPTHRALAQAVVAVVLGGVLLGCQPLLTDDGTPSILGRSNLTGDDLIAWWDSTGRGQPAALTAPIAEVLVTYISEGEAEGVRGDYALAQAVLETGWFTSANAAINNFAGIGDYGAGDVGYVYPDAVTGVRAHIQLLKKFAAGNDVALARPEVAPDAKAHAVSWGGLAGTWATSPNYWTTLARVDARLCG